LLQEILMKQWRYSELQVFVDVAQLVTWD
jgi:hypothetical protein